jgi:hypothetical protein
MLIPIRSVRSIGTTNDLVVLANSPQLDPCAVGKLLGAGLQHRIYEYHDKEMPMVLKIATPTPGLRYPSVQDAQADVKFISQFFKPYAVEPTEVIPLQEASYAIKQRRLSEFHTIAPDDLRNETVKEEFLDVLQRNQNMLTQVGRSLDFLGREGQRQARAALIGLRVTPTISNLVIEHQRDGAPSLRIIDTDLENFHPAGFTLRDRLSRVAAQLAVQINRWIIRRFFGIDILALPQV